MKQREALEILKMGENVFLTGPAGSKQGSRLEGGKKSEQIDLEFFDDVKEVDEVIEPFDKKLSAIS